MKTTVEYSALTVVILGMALTGSEHLGTLSRIGQGLPRKPVLLSS